MCLAPNGLPVDANTRTGLVVQTGTTRFIDWNRGSNVFTYAFDDQPSNDASRANGAGWNCRTHLEYEGSPAVDWYIPLGTPVYATMSGTASLYVITTSNTFDFYGVDRGPYLGNPDRARAPLSPFPGPGGGKGVFVRVENQQFTTEYAHLYIRQTISNIPTSAFLPGYSFDTNYESTFARMRDFRSSPRIASWPVNRGDILGLSGDSGYSEAPHLHYTVSRTGGPLLCPTGEAGFTDGGWLFR